MTWLKLDDSFAEHPKVIELSDGAFRLHVTAMCYCARNPTDGFVSQSVIRNQLARYKRFVVELVRRRLWDECEGGYQIHDFLKYNPSSDRKQATSESRAEAGRIGGQRSGEARRNQNGKQTDEANGKQFASPMLEANANPVPVPVNFASNEAKVGAQKRPPRPAFSDEDRAALVPSPTVCVDPLRISQAISNLLHNAAKYTNLRLYVRNWLKRDLDELRQKGIVPIGKNKPLDDPFASMVVRGYDS